MKIGSFLFSGKTLERGLFAQDVGKQFFWIFKEVLRTVRQKLLLGTEAPEDGKAGEMCIFCRGNIDVAISYIGGGVGVGT